MSGIVVEVDASVAMRKLRAAGVAFSPTGFLKALGESQLSWIARNFSASGALAGGWKPLSPNTIAARRQGSSAPLQDTGRMRQSFGYEVTGSELRTGTGVRAGASVRYASFHQDGVPAAKMNPILPKNLRREVRIINGRPRNVIVGVLSWMTKDGRRYAMAVRNHPGIPRRRMLPEHADVTRMAKDLADALIARINATR